LVKLLFSMKLINIFTNYLN